LTEEISLSSQPVAHIADVCTCPHCHTESNIEQAFTAFACVETIELWDGLSDTDKKGIKDLDDAKIIASRLILADANKPILVCHECGKPIELSVRHERHQYEVPAFLSCQCGQEIDLRYPGDSKRVKFTAEFPHVPFLHCLSCRQKVLLPIRGIEAWRVWVFRLINTLHNIKAMLC
jgi:hypothetical protein